MFLSFCQIQSYKLTFSLLYLGTVNNKNPKIRFYKPLKRENLTQI